MLDDPVTPVRTITLQHREHRLRVNDAFEGAGHHLIEIPLHLAPGVVAVEKARGYLSLLVERRRVRTSG